MVLATLEHPSVSWTVPNKKEMLLDERAQTRLSVLTLRKQEYERVIEAQRERQALLS